MRDDFGSTHVERRLIRLSLKAYLETRAGGSLSAMSEQMVEFYREAHRDGAQRTLWGAPVDRTKLSKCLNHGEKRGDAGTYRKVAGYLVDTGFFPPADMEDLTFGLMSHHFNGGLGSAQRALERLPGAYNYQEASNDGVPISTGRLIIGEPTASQYAPVWTEPDDNARIRWRGVVFCDDRPSACLILRGSTWGQACFCMFQSFTSPSQAAPFTSLAGYALSSEREINRSPATQLSLTRLEDHQIKAAE